MNMIKKINHVKGGGGGGGGGEGGGGVSKAVSPPRSQNNLIQT